MDFLKNYDGIIIFICFVFPGFVFFQAYRLYIIPNEPDWSKSIIHAAFFSAFYFVAFMPLSVKIICGMSALTKQKYDWIFHVFSLLYFFLLPVSFALISVMIVKYGCLKKYGLLSMHATAWDFVFSQRRKFFIVIYLNNGKAIGGYFGEHSFAGTYPKEGDIFLSHAYKIDNDGSFGEKIKATAGLMIRKDQYCYIEFRNVPEKGGKI